MPVNRVRLVGDVPTGQPFDAVVTGGDLIVVRVGDQAAIVGGGPWKTRAEWKRLHQAVGEVLAAWT